ncbi:hypothetical protein GXP70_12285 [Paenibacillus lycopersici]|uniref:Uncharacterized protein n=1 Tax=Paenibacillus lycopersici TaxID=2704462 RepID=A0A6C0FYT8_9BACL|nr:hypothetical protein [Paenibacillus lycopersici]QHT60641.1 hypothetical protein GXP70_12285 [Paenibacillus lycopersici]
MQEAKKLLIQAQSEVNNSTGFDQQIMRMVQYFSEEAPIVEAQLAAGIEALEQIAAIAQRALGKSFGGGEHGGSTRTEER